MFANNLYNLFTACPQYVLLLVCAFFLCTVCWYHKSISAVCTYFGIVDTENLPKQIKDMLSCILAHSLRDTWEFLFSLDVVPVAILRQHSADSWTACSKTALGRSDVHAEFIITCPEFSRETMFLLVRRKVQMQDFDWMSCVWKVNGSVLSKRENKHQLLVYLQCQRLQASKNRYIL